MLLVDGGVGEAAVVEALEAAGKAGQQACVEVLQVRRVVVGMEQGGSSSSYCAVAERQVEDEWHV